MYILGLTALAIIVCWRRGDWRNWKQYHATILFFMLSDVVHNLLIYNHPLWRYTLPSFNHVLATLIVVFLIYPATVLIFVHRCPQRSFPRALYILQWVAIYAAAEYVGLRLGYMHYYHGWSFGFSVLFLLVSFPIILLHYYKPLWAYAAGFLVGGIMLWYFRLPIGG